MAPVSRAAARRLEATMTAYITALRAREITRAARGSAEARQAVAQDAYRKACAAHLAAHDATEKARGKLDALLLNEDVG